MDLRPSVSKREPGLAAVAESASSGFEFKGQRKQVTKFEKLHELTLKNPGKVLAIGLRDSVALTARNLHVERVASVKIFSSGVVNPEENYIHFFDSVLRDFDIPVKRYVVVSVIVGQVNKAHLITVQIYSEHDQTYRVTGAEGIPEQTFVLSSGWHNVLYAFLPTKQGKAQFEFFPYNGREGPAARAHFVTQVELDVAD